MKNVVPIFRPSIYQSVRCMSVGWYVGQIASKRNKLSTTKLVIMVRKIGASINGGKNLQAKCRDTMDELVK